ncbi:MULTISPECIES: YqaA family protein [Pseudomonas]|jgi:membrane protein YqaA with SNARE-associated domain|uniref:YqaA family protein n=1 Tax=Pseudomonas sp. Hg7Tf TaxID=3236988 RepID=A0AB39I778_9PSED|nr:MULTISPECIES: YqaA family protein [Pseudomonas]KJK05851.1 membrane protein [Pseudomonas sp. 5]MDD1978890.1 DedA family protein [Pseudomonas putida]MDH2558916.1 DedA family protein [Pseudomonas sp. Hg5Tf]QYX49508.1 DedA family protein [Pseudomonas sp. S11A 273]
MLSEWALFFSAFGAATLLPLQSEAVLVGLLLHDRQALYSLLLIATAGNVLGSIVNWLLGRGIEHLRDRRWFPFKPAQLEKAQQRYQRYGQWSLLLSWMPVIGDPLTLIAGIMREPFWRFVLLVTLAKAGRYVVLALLTVGWMQH